MQVSTSRTLWWPTSAALVTRSPTLAPRATIGSITPITAPQSHVRWSTQPHDLGLAVCGSGIGIAIAANKVPGARAATCHDFTSARLARLHNDANVLCLGERLIGQQVALDMVEVFLSTSFEGGRHTARVEKLTRLDGRG